MKKTNQKKHLLSGWAVVLLGVLLFASCVDEAYDLSEDNISTEVSFGGENLGITLGSSSESSLKDILDLDDQDNITTDSDGNYMMELEQSIDPVSFSIDDINIDKIEIDDVSLTIKESIFSLLPSGIALWDDISLDVEDSVHIEVNQSITQDEVNSISQVSFKKENDQYPSLKMDIEFGGFPKPADGYETENNKVVVDKMEITLPDNIITETGESVFLFDGDCLLSDTDNNGSYEGHFPIEIPIVGVINEGDSKDISIAEEIKFTIDCTLKTKGQQSSDFIEGNAVKMSIRLVDISLSSSSADGNLGIYDVTGKFNFTELIEQTIDNIELPDVLSDESVVLDFMHTAILLDVESDFPYPLTANINLVPVLDGGLSFTEGEVVIEDLVVEGGDSSYWISDDTKYMPSGATQVEETISGLINCKPQDIKVNFDVSLSEEQMTITVGEYTIAPAFKVMAPFQMGSKTQLVYELDDLIDISGLYDYCNAFEISISGENTIPLDVSLLAAVVDENGNQLQGFDVTSEGVLSSSKASSSSTSKLVLTISETSSSQLEDAENLQLKFVFTSSEALDAQFLNQDQYLQLDLEAKIIGGLIFDTDDL